MSVIRAVVFSVAVASVASASSFPPGFRFGAATASHQVEGAWNASDKSPSIWDSLTHNHPQAVVDGTNADVACDSYRLWRRDIELCQELGVHFYRFSLSWPRLLPNGLSNHISEDGTRYYNSLIDGLISAGIEPVVTLYHWDLPQSLQDLGGWTNPLIVEWFGDYARTAYTLFGDRVKTWLTINEALVVCDVHYYFRMVPNSLPPGIADYLCNKNVLMAHAKAYRIYHEEFKPKYHGRVSLTNQLIWMEPRSDSPEDEDLAELARQYIAGRYSHPIFSKEGGWPKAIEQLIAKRSREEGYPASRLPAFTKEEIEFVKGTFDFYGMNHYTSRIVRPLTEDDSSRQSSLYVGILNELNVFLDKRPEWELAASAWFYVYPEGIRRQLAWLKKTYGNMEVVIFENGYSSKDSDIQDHKRVQYYRDNLEQVALSIREDGVNVTGYTAWTLIDNFEWTDGFSNKFGIYAVDFNSPDRTRTARNSALYYKAVIEANRVLEISEVFKEEKTLR